MDNDTSHPALLLVRVIADVRLIHLGIIERARISYAKV